MTSLRRAGWSLFFGVLAGCSSDPVPANNDSGTATDRGTAVDTPTTADTGVVPDGGTATDVQTATDAQPGADVQAADVPPAGPPTLTIASPAANANLPVGAPSQLMLNITNFNLVNFVGATGNVAGSGHVHVYLDAADGNADYLVADYIANPRVVIPSTTSLGPHSLRVSLRQNNHDPLSPPVEARVNFTAVTNTGPTVIVASPAENTSVAVNANLTLMLTLMNFTARDFAGQTGINPPNGHLHVYLDGASGGDYLIATHLTNPTVRIPAGTSVGAHRLVVSLRNDDHSEIAGANASLRINVTP